MNELARPCGSGADIYETNIRGDRRVVSRALVGKDARAQQCTRKMNTKLTRGRTVDKMEGNLLNLYAP